MPSRGLRHQRPIGGDLQYLGAHARQALLGLGGGLRLGLRALAHLMQSILRSDQREQREQRQYPPIGAIALKRSHSARRYFISNGGFIQTSRARRRNPAAANHSASASQAASTRSARHCEASAQIQRGAAYSKAGTARQ